MASNIPQVNVFHATISLLIQVGKDIIHCMPLQTGIES